MEASLPDRKEPGTTELSKGTDRDQVAAKELFYQRRIAELTQTVEALQQ